MFNKSAYLIRERLSLLKLVDRYDIIDPTDGRPVAYARENISMAVKGLRLFLDKKLLPTTVEICDAGTNEVLYKIRRPVSLLRSKVEILNKEGNVSGYFRSRLISLGGRFDVYNRDGKVVAAVKGNWTGWNFRMEDEQGRELGEVTKKWAGIGQELFTSADNYVVSIHPNVQGNQEITALLLMAGLAVDLVYKEKD